MEAKAIKKPSQKSITKMMPNMNPNWSQRGSQIEAKIIKNEVLEVPCFKSGSQVASRPPPGSILERFWDHLGTIFISFSGIYFFYDFCMHSVAACCKHKRSKSQGNTKRMQQKASKKQLLSSCRLALKSSLANVNELSGPCQYRLRQDRYLLLRQDRCLLLGQDRCLLRQDKCLLLQEQTSVSSQYTMMKSQESQLSQYHNVQVSDRRSGPKSTKIVRNGSRMVAKF